MFISDRFEAAQVSRLTVEMHDHDSAAALIYGVTYFTRIEGKCTRIDIHEDRCRARVFDGGYRCHRGMRDRYHLITCTDAAGTQGQFDCVSSTRYPNRVRKTVISSELCFECFHLRTQNIPAAVGDTSHGR